jgi:hypothetical protein
MTNIKGGIQRNDSWRESESSEERDHRPCHEHASEIASAKRSRIAAQHPSFRSFSLGVHRKKSNSMLASMSPAPCVTATITLLREFTR